MTLAQQLVDAVRPFGITGLSVADLRDQSTWRFTGGVQMDVPSAVSALVALVDAAPESSVAQLQKALVQVQSRVDAIAEAVSESAAVSSSPAQA